MYPFEKLEIWQLSLDLVEKIYKITAKLPEDEKFGLSSQLKRVAVSVSLNIAEGRASDSDAEFRRFLGISLKSLVEIIACMKVCERLGFLENIVVKDICEFCDKIEAKTRKFRNALSVKRQRRQASSVKREA
ncbi:MAG: four helix bundle protein [Candidatus Edwardsbacteria bacterium]